MNSIFFLLPIHWLADYCLQTQWQANNKYKDNIALGMHVLTYMFVWLLVLFPMYGITSIGWVLWNGVTHLIIDFCTSRATHMLYEEKCYHDFFVVLGVDQLLHIFIMVWTYEALVDIVKQ